MSALRLISVLRSPICRREERTLPNTGGVVVRSDVRGTVFYGGWTADDLDMDLQGVGVVPRRAVSFLR